VANVQEFRQDGSQVELDEDGYILDPQVGDVDDCLTCMECLTDSVRVTLKQIEEWGTGTKTWFYHAGRFEWWLCDPCLDESEVNSG
jgi:hypothetical protein